MANLGENDYRTGAQARLLEAQSLHRNKFFAGGVYLAGRGVEGMLRAVIWKRDHEVMVGQKSLGTGHDLRDLLTEIAKLGLLQRADRDEEFRVNVHRNARLWFNDMRFVSARYIERRWRKIGAIPAGATFPIVAREYHGWCLEVSKRCEALCEQ